MNKSFRFVRWFHCGAYFGGLSLSNLNSFATIRWQMKSIYSRKSTTKLKLSNLTFRLSQLGRNSLTVLPIELYEFSIFEHSQNEVSENATKLTEHKWRHQNACHNIIVWRPFASHFQMHLMKIDSIAPNGRKNKISEDGRDRNAATAKMKRERERERDDRIKYSLYFLSPNFSIHDIDVVSYNWPTALRVSMCAFYIHSGTCTQADIHLKKRVKHITSIRVWART